MRPLTPLEMIGLGFGLVVIGFLIPLLMTLRVIEAGFLLALVGHGASVAGLLLGLLGAAQYVRRE